jgi:hypothetical protein
MTFLSSCSQPDPSRWLEGAEPAFCGVLDNVGAVEDVVANCRLTAQESAATDLIGQPLHFLFC